MEQIEDPKRVKFYCLKLKGHVSLWWDNVQDDRMRKGKEKVKTRDRMVVMLKDKSFPTTT